MLPDIANQNPVSIFTLTFKEEKPTYPAEKPKSKEELEKAYNFHLMIFKDNEDCKVKLGKISPTRARIHSRRIKKAKRSNDYKIILPIVVEKQQ